MIGMRSFYIDTISADKVAEEIYNNSNTKNCELKIDEANANIIKKNKPSWAYLRNQCFIQRKY